MGTPTVYDVAEHAGVSIATVSRVYRNPDSVRAVTRDRVLVAARELGYVPSGSARGLANRATRVLGLYFPDFHETASTAGTDGEDGTDSADEAGLMLYSDEVIHGMERAARRHGYALLIAAAHTEAPEERAAEIAGHVDGLAVLGRAVPEEQLALIVRRRPVVMLAGERSAAHDHIEVANFAGQHELTRHLLADHGLRRLAFIGGNADSADGEARFRGFRAAHQEAGLPLPEAPDMRTELTQEAGSKATAELLDRALLTGAELPECLVFANDQMAVGGLHALESRGVRVPHDMAVTGFDGIPLGRLVRPPLTTVRQPMGRLGEQAVELLLARLADPDRRHEHRLLPVTLMRRASCGCDDRAA